MRNAIQNNLQVSRINGSSSHLAGLAERGKSVAAAGHFNSDQEALSHWLAIYDLRRRETARGYRSQVRKWRLFLEITKPNDDPATLLKNATEVDVALYESAITHESLPGGQSARIVCPPHLVAALGLRQCPFSSPLKRSSANHAISVLHAMYEFFRRPSGTDIQPYRNSNPVGRVIKSKERGIRQTDRHIPIEGIRALRVTAEHMVKIAVGDTEKLIAARTQCALDLLFGLWSRRHEITQLRVRDLREDPSGGWIIEINRKGGDIDAVPVAGWVMASYRKYRSAMGLSPDLDPLDSSPLLVNHQLRSSNGLAKPISDTVLYTRIKTLAKRCAQDLGELAPEVGLEPHKIEPMRRRLNQISPHWFRHSGPTIAINGELISVSLASKMLGHATEATTTSMYYHADESMMRDGLNKLACLL